MSISLLYYTCIYFPSSSFCRNKEALFTRCVVSTIKKTAIWRPEVHPLPVICYVVLSPLGTYMYSSFDHFATLACRSLPQLYVTIGALCTGLNCPGGKAWQSSRVKTTLSIRCFKFTANVLPTINPLLNLVILLRNKNLIRYHLL